MVEVIETVWIPMPDGANLAARLWLPEGAREKPVPAILEYIPYRRRDQTRVRDESMHPHFAHAGYASIRVDMRGAGDSDGLMLDEYADIETQDGVDVIAWLAAQNWCDGNVGMFGKSWGAYNSVQVAAKRPPALKAIAPVMGTDDRWLEDVHFYGGVLCNDNFWWGSIMQLYNSFPPDPQIVGKGWRDIWKNRLDNMSFWPAMWAEHQTHDEMWRRGSISENYDDIQIPTYFFGGWADLFRDTPFRMMENMSSPLKVMMGPWAHLYPHEGKPGPRADFIGEVIRFWDTHLKGLDRGLDQEPDFKFYLQDSAPPLPIHKFREGRWVAEDVWPSPNVTSQSLWMNEHGLSASGKQGAELSICSPQTFGSAGGEMVSFAIPGDIPVDCRLDAGGALNFKGDMLDNDLDILGQPSLTMKVKSDKPQGFVVGLLVDEAPDGSQQLISRGFCNLMHLKSDMEPTPVTPGEVLDITVPLYGAGYRVLKGHRLVVQVATAYWPILWPSPEAMTLTVLTGQSRLNLPVRGDVDDSAVTVAEPPRIARNHAIETIKEGSLKRVDERDVTTGELVATLYVDGGVFGAVGRRRLTDIGTEMGAEATRVYRIHPNDPLSATATMDQEAIFHRDDWSVTMKTTSKMTCTKTSFLFDASVECWDGDTLFHSVEWKHEVPRNGM